MLDDTVLIYWGIWLGTTFQGAVPNILITFSKREYLWDLAAPLHSRYAAQSRGGDMRLHFTGLSRIDLATLHTHTHNLTQALIWHVTLDIWHLFHQQSTLFPLGFQTMFKLELKKRRRKKSPLFLTSFFHSVLPLSLHHPLSIIAHPLTPSLNWRW